MQRLEVSDAVRHIYIYIIRRLKVKKVNVKQTRYRTGVAHRVPGGLGSQISMTLST